MAPILRHPDLDLPFVVEVDASSSGLGAVLSQRHGKPGKLHPCAFYSRKLTSAEVNYDVGNRELLAIKAALEEWRHWLEGVRHPFQVLTDHRNLEYLRGAKRLNPRQASDPASGAVEPRRGDLTGSHQRTASCRLSTYQNLRATTLPTAGYTVGAQGPQLRTSRHSPIYPARPQPVLVALPGFGCGGVRQVMLHVCAGADQSSTSGGAAGASSGPSTPLVAPVGGLPDRPTGLRRLYDSDGGGGSFLVNPVAYRLRLPASYRICPTFHVSLLKPAHLSAVETGACGEPPPPLDIEGSPAYQVRALLNSRRVRSRLQYLMDWEGYGPEERSWVEATDILDPSLVEDFHRDHPNKPAPRTRGRPRRKTPGGVPRGVGSVTTRARGDREREPSPVF
ncbi:hypothetical protein QTP86_027868 [Hemibagrus guttatus]|nr:hypothetical protein QTP86_027868 [Hemibagrus guttatus]